MQLTADLDDDLVSRFSTLVSAAALSISILKAQKNVREIQWLLDEKPNQQDFETNLIIAANILGIPDQKNMNLCIAKVEDKNWLKESYRGFAPFRVGRFYICGTHENPNPKPDEIPLIIDAATAFGSGEHGTTAGCLLLMEGLKSAGFTPENILDLGCGSGILAIAACKLWNCPVLATDIDPESISVSLHHRDVNAIGPQLQTLIGDGFSIIDNHFDLIIANILAGPLMDMAEDLSTRIKSGGYAILSGLLQDQAPNLIGQYKKHGLRLIRQCDRGEWSALLLQK